jgi:oligopeptide transport system substrate-binding protein
MNETRFISSFIALAVIALSCFLASCTSSAKGRYFGETVVTNENVLRYITGSEPESLDPALPNGQPEARILMALYDGLIEYHPVTVDPIPGIAESWEGAGRGY